MTRPRQVRVLAWFTLVGLWRRWFFVIPFGVVMVVFLSQTPRLFYIAKALAEPAGRSKALTSYTGLVSGVYDQYLLMGSVLALALGAAAVGSRRLRTHVLPLLARPVARSEFLLGRFVGNSCVMLVFWAAPALAVEIVRTVVHVPVRVTAAGYVAPLALQLLLLALGMALGSLLPALPATCCGLVGFVAVSNLQNADGSSALLGGLRFFATWCMPPFNPLGNAAAPFVSPASLLPAAAMYCQAVLWLVIFLLIATWRYETSDFTARGH